MKRDCSVFFVELQQVQVKITRLWMIYIDMRNWHIVVGNLISVKVATKISIELSFSLSMKEQLILQTLGIQILVAFVENLSKQKNL